MTVNNSANKVVVAGNGVQTVFSFGFIAVDASDIEVIYTDASSNQTTLDPQQYSIALNPAGTGQLWAIGGTVTYPLSGSPIANGTSLTIARELSLTQLVSLSNQGNTFPSAVEQALDLLEMQLQQVYELFQRALVAPIVDPSAPLPLPAAAQRANQALLFDASGNPIAGAIPASGVISSAMQSVVDAATLALGRQAFGLGSMATEGIGAGLEDDGSGNARVFFAISQLASSAVIGAADHLNAFITTGPITLTLSAGASLFNGFGFWIYNSTAGAVTLTPNAADTIQGYSSGQSVNIPPNTSCFVTTDGAANANWVIQYGLSSAAPMTSGGFSGLVVANSASSPNDHIDVSASDLTLPSIRAGGVRQTNVAFTINCTTSGANGMDTGALPVSGWVYVYAISNGATIAGLASLSSTNPTLPTGYTYAKRLGAMRTDSSGHLMRTRQLGNKVAYQVTTGSNTTSPPSLTSGNAAFWTQVSVASVVPPTASQIKLVLSAVLGANSNTYAAAAPNNSYNTGTPSASHPIAVGGNANGTTNAAVNEMAEFNLESTSVFYGATGTFSSVALVCYGWTDNL